MAVNVSPFGPKPTFVDPVSGVIANGYKVFFYVAGSVGTKQNSFTDSTGLVANTNPIILNAAGEPATQIWFTAGQLYKVVIASPTDTDPPTNGTILGDNLSGINDVTAAVTEWISGPTPTFVSATSFTLVGDQTSTFTVGRRCRFTVTAGTVYGTITISAFTALTTVTAVIDSGALDAGLSAISYGLLAANHPSIPSTALDQPTVTVASATTTNLTSAGARSVIVSGTTAITAITLGNGQEASVEFSASLTLTNGASLILPGGANITTAAGDMAILRGEASSVVRCVSYIKANGAPITLSPITNSLGGDVSLNNASNYFDGPSVAQGTAGVWFVSGSVTVLDSAGAANFSAKLWDGTTIINSGFIVIRTASDPEQIALSGFITGPVGNLRISVRDNTSTSGLIRFNASGNSKDSTITAVRIA